MPVAVALSITVTGAFVRLVSVIVHVKVQTAPGSRVVVFRSELLTRMGDAQTVPVKVTPVMGVLPVFVSV